MNKAVETLTKKIAAQIEAAGYQWLLLIHDGAETYATATGADSAYMAGRLIGLLVEDMTEKLAESDAATIEEFQRGLKTVKLYQDETQGTTGRNLF